jgi:hypothetical protein
MNALIRHDQLLNLQVGRDISFNNFFFFFVQMEMVWNDEAKSNRPSKTMNTKDDAVRWPEFG